MQGDSEGYYSPENSLLQHVLTAGKGIPITLAIIHAAVGRRAGLPISCVNMPRHFMNRFGDFGHPDERFIDAFDGGKLLTRYASTWPSALQHLSDASDGGERCSPGMLCLDPVLCSTIREQVYGQIVSLQGGRQVFCPDICLDPYAPMLSRCCRSSGPRNQGFA